MSISFYLPSGLISLPALLPWASQRAISCPPSLEGLASSFSVGIKHPDRLVCCPVSSWACSSGCNVQDIWSDLFIWGFPSFLSGSAIIHLSVPHVCGECLGWREGEEARASACHTAGAVGVSSWQHIGSIRELAMCSTATTEDTVNGLSCTHQAHMLWNVVACSSWSTSGFFPKLD